MSIPTILDNLIAMVVVLLILSLVVQSIQSGLKKLLKIKSRQIEDSLIDLFEHVLNKAPSIRLFPSAISYSANLVLAKASLGVL